MMAAGSEFPSVAPRLLHWRAAPSRTGHRFRPRPDAHRTACPGQRTRWPPCARHGGRVILVTGKADVLRKEGVSVYVGDHVHDVEGALAAGALSVSVLTGGCTREELLDAGTHVVLDDLTQFPGMARRAPARGPALGRWRATWKRGGACWSRSAAEPTARSCWPPRSERCGADRVVAATAYSDSLPAAERDPARAFAESLGVRVLTPTTHEMEREGYRANAGDRCYFCKAELLDVLTPLADRSAWPTWPPEPMPTTPWPGSGRASGRQPSAVRSPRSSMRADQGTDARGVASPGSCRRGTSRPRRACPRGWRTASR